MEGGPCRSLAAGDAHADGPSLWGHWVGSFPSKAQMKTQRWSKHIFPWTPAAWLWQQLRVLSQAEGLVPARMACTSLASAQASKRLLVTGLTL